MICNAPHVTMLPAPRVFNNTPPRSLWSRNVSLVVGSFALLTSGTCRATTLTFISPSLYGTDTEACWQEDLQITTKKQVGLLVLCCPI